MNYHNHDYDGGSPDVPLSVGDRFYGQDRGRDFRYLQDTIGEVIEDLIADQEIKVRGGTVSKGSGDTLDITAFSGYTRFEVDVPGDFGAANPPSVTQEDIVVRVFMPTQTTVPLTSATLDGVTTNYVKVGFQEATVYSRARAKKAGSYAYEVEATFVLTVDTTAPVAKEILLATFVAPTGGDPDQWTIDNEPNNTIEDLSRRTTIATPQRQPVDVAELYLVEAVDGRIVDVYNKANNRSMTMMCEKFNDGTRDLVIWVPKNLSEARQVHGGEGRYFKGADNGLWSTASNWQPQTIPTALGTDDIEIREGIHIDFQGGARQAANWIIRGGSAGTGTFNASAGCWRATRTLTDQLLPVSFFGVGSDGSGLEPVGPFAGWFGGNIYTAINFGATPNADYQMTGDVVLIQDTTGTLIVATGASTQLHTNGFKLIMEGPTGAPKAVDWDHTGAVMDNPDGLIVLRRVLDIQNIAGQNWGDLLIQDDGGGNTYVTLTQNLTVEDIIIEQNATLDLNGNTLTVNGTQYNRGTIIP